MNEQNVNSIQVNLERKMRWLMYTRWALYVVVFLSVLINKPQDSFIYYALLLYGVTTAGYLAVLSSHRWKQKPNLVKFIRILPLTLEIIVEVALVHLTGGIQSPYITLLVLSIVTAAFLYRLTGTLIVTTYASILLTVTVYAEWQRLIDFDLGVPLEQSIYANQDAIWASIYIYVIVFYIIALLAGYLSRRLHVQVQKIQSLDREISGLRLRTDEIMEKLPSGIIILDRNQNISYFNEISRKFLHISDYFYVGQPIKTFLAESFPALLAILEDFKDKTMRRELILTSKGQKRIIKVSIMALSLENIPPGTLIVLEDITNEKHRQTLIDESKRQAAIGDMSARFAHEIRNPLASIRGSVEMLMGNMNLPPEDKRLFELVVRESDRLADFLEDFLVFARLRELPDAQFSRDKVDIGKMLDELILLTSSHPAFHLGIVVSNKIPVGTCFVRGQADQLSKVFANIFINAYQAMKMINGEISCSIVPVEENLFDSELVDEEKMVGISIVDSGKGMTEKEMESLFTPFVTSKSLGAGLGMAITNSIVNKHDGYIEVNSKPNEGTRFIVNLEKYQRKAELSF